MLLIYGLNFQRLKLLTVLLCFLISFSLFAEISPIVNQTKLNSKTLWIKEVEKVKGVELSLLKQMEKQKFMYWIQIDLDLLLAEGPIEIFSNENRQDKKEYSQDFLDLLKRANYYFQKLHWSSEYNYLDVLNVDLLHSKHFIQTAQSNLEILRVDSSEAINLSEFSTNIYRIKYFTKQESLTIFLLQKASVLILFGILLLFLLQYKKI